LWLVGNSLSSWLALKSNDCEMVIWPSATRFSSAAFM
jgi:hypothetical protein